MRLRVSRQSNVKGPPWSIVVIDGDSRSIETWHRYHFTHKRAMDAADYILGRIDIREYNERGVNVRPRVR